LISYKRGQITILDREGLERFELTGQKGLIALSLTGCDRSA
jgi:hypothetical protein